jgi:glutathione S-transferase
MAPKLYYFADRRGDAECIRIMFKEASIAFEEVGVNQDQFKELDAAGDLLFGQLPMLDWDGIKLVETPAILEHIAVQADKAGRGSNKYLGVNENERSTARSLCSAAAEMRRELMIVRQNKGGASAKSDFKNNLLPPFFKAIDRLAVASSDEDEGLGEGVHFTFGDVAVFEVINAICEEYKVGILRPYPNMKEWHDKAIARAAIEKHVGSRPAADW